MFPRLLLMLLDAIAKHNAGISYGFRDISYLKSRMHHRSRVIWHYGSEQRDGVAGLHGAIAMKPAGKRAAR